MLQFFLGVNNSQTLTVPAVTATATATTPTAPTFSPTANALGVVVAPQIPLTVSATSVVVVNDTTTPKRPVSVPVVVRTGADDVIHRIVSRMTAAEVSQLCYYYNLINAQYSLDPILRGYGALTALECDLTASIGTLSTVGGKRRYSGGRINTGSIEGAVRCPNAKAYEVLDWLKKKYTDNPSGFLTAAGFTSTRAAQLTAAETQTSRQPGTLQTIRVPCWPENPPNSLISTEALATGMMYKTVGVFYGQGTTPLNYGYPPNPTYVKGLVEAASSNGALPRVITMADSGNLSFIKQSVSIGGTWQYGYYDGDFTDPQSAPGVWTETWHALKVSSPDNNRSTWLPGDVGVYSDWKWFWRRYSEVGGQVDDLCLDMEAVSHWYVIFSQDKFGERNQPNTGGFGGVGNKIMSDLRWPALAARLPMNSTDWSTVDVIGSGGWQSIAGDERVMLWNAKAQERYATTLQDLSDIVHQYFPNCRIHAYEVPNFSAAIYHSQEPVQDLMQYDNGVTPTGQSMIPSTNGLYGTTRIATEPIATWDWRLNSRWASDDKPYDLLCNYVSALRGTVATTTKERPVCWTAWRDYVDSNNPSLNKTRFNYDYAASNPTQTSGYWQELMAHIVLSGCQPWYYHDQLSDDNQENIYAAMIQEINAAVRYGVPTPYIEPDVNYSDNYIISRADDGGDWIIRLTTKPELLPLTSLTPSGDDLIVDVAGLELLTFQRASQLTTVVNGSMPQGFWIRQRGLATEDAGTAASQSSVSAPSVVLNARVLSPGSAVGTCVVVPPAIYNTVVLTAPTATAQAVASVVNRTLGEVTLTVDTIDATAAVVIPDLSNGTILSVPAAVATGDALASDITLGEISDAADVATATSTVASPAISVAGLTQPAGGCDAYAMAIAPVIYQGLNVAVPAAVATSTVIAPNYQKPAYPHHTYPERRRFRSGGLTRRGFDTNIEER